MAANSKNQDDKLMIRIKQLSLSKVMVTIHRKSLFLLVTAHCDLGEAYLEAKCYQQSLDHLT